MEKLSFLSEEQVRHIQSEYGTPVFVYDQATLQSQAQKALDFPNAFGLTARYAMKACPNISVIRILNSAGLHIDASSGYEARRAMRAGARLSADRPICDDPPGGAERHPVGRAAQQFGL